MYNKDPQAVLDYKFDWAPKTHDTGASDYLEAGEAIRTARISIAPVTNPPLVDDADALTDSDASVTVWLSGGLVDVNYQVACLITTNQGRTDERTMQVMVRDR